jgi:hypothetical protein
MDRSGSFKDGNGVSVKCECHEIIYSVMSVLLKILLHLMILLGDPKQERKQCTVQALA